MRLHRLFLSLGLLAFLSVPSFASTVLSLSALTPASAPAGSSEITLVLKGSGFDRRTVALWNGSSRRTKYISSTELRAQIPASDLAVATVASVQAMHSRSGAKSSQLGFTVEAVAPAPLAITTLTLPAGTVGQSYSAALQATGGVTPYSWRLISGQLPPGLGLATSGSISGTPSSAGDFTFSVEVKDSATSGQQAALGSFTISVAASTSTSTQTSIGSRGYVTTPGELREIASKAGSGVEPYKSALASLKNYATSDPAYWPYGTISGYQTCTAPKEPQYIWGGSGLVQAKAMLYHLTGDSRYASDVRLRILDLLDSYGYNETSGSADKYSGSNNCILNLSWYMHGWIVAADLLEDYSGWSASDKQSFQKWLAEIVFRKVEWSSDVRSNNWGSAASATTGMIADYLTGSGIKMIDRNGVQIGPKAAYDEAKKRQIDRMNGNTYMDNYTCKQPVGIRADGGIPEELGRGATGCDGLWILTPHDLTNPSYYYPQTYMQGTTAHAEFLLRRGDRTLYEHITSTGLGSFRRAIHFLLNNPNDPSKSAPWWESAKQQLEMTYRYYRDSYIAKQLRIGTTSRYVGGRNSQMVHFGTLTHGFATNENPGLPPTVPPPSD